MPRWFHVWIFYQHKKTQKHLLVSLYHEYVYMNSKKCEMLPSFKAVHYCFIHRHNFLASAIQTADSFFHTNFTICTLFCINCSRMNNGKWNEEGMQYVQCWQEISINFMELLMLPKCNLCGRKFNACREFSHIINLRAKKISQNAFHRIAALMNISSTSPFWQLHEWIIHFSSFIFSFIQ